MTEDGVVVDTSVLVSFFRGKGEHVEEVTRLIHENRLVITGLIIAELLQGIKGIKEEEQLSDVLTGIPALELTTDIWIRAGKTSLSLRRKGINLPLTDVAIATLAIEHHLPIFTLDKHFEQIPGLKIYRS